MSVAAKWVVLVCGVAIISVLIGLYIGVLSGGPTPYRAPVAQAATGKTVDLRLMTVAAIGPKLSPNENWVSYLVQENGVWKRSTVWTLPANATVHVTIYNFDGQSGLRNPFLAQARGVAGGTFQIDGRAPQKTIDPATASHTFAVPELGLLVPIYGVADDAKNQCGYAPCPMGTAHETVTFTFHTGKKGHYRWQCFVPCAAGFVYGFGGPMQTVGYMDGYLDVV